MAAQHTIFVGVDGTGDVDHRWFKRCAAQQPTTNPLALNTQCTLPRI
jgi:hypothetical protein